MMGVQYDPKISLGTIAEVVALLLVFGGGYVTLTNADTRQVARLDGHDADIARISKTLEENTKNLHEDLKQIGADLQRQSERNGDAVQKLDEKITRSLIDNVRNKQPR